jgi:hypothetical protein
LGKKEHGIMRVANTIRMLVLASLIVAGFVVYQGRDVSGENDPVAVTSLIPSPVSVTALSGHSS